MKLIKKVLTAGRAAALLAAAGMMFPGCGETITKTEYEEFEVPDYKEGTGGTAVTAENFIKIGDPEYAEEFPLGGEYKLDGDITLPPEGWQPVGSAAAPFSGKLHGSGHTITLTLPDSHLQYTGLFGYMKGAIIDNLNINLANDYGTVLVFDDENTKKDVEGVPAVLDSEDYVYLGILAAYAEDSIISGVTLGAEEGKGLNFRNTTAAPVSAGGILGYGLDIILTNSSSSVNIKAESAGWTGGIIGCLAKSDGVLTYLTIKGDIDIDATDDKTVYAGGIAGSIGADVLVFNNECGSKKISVSITQFGTVYAGGIAGQAATGASGCVLSSALALNIDDSLSGTTTSAIPVVYTGGLFGNMYNDKVIKDCSVTETGSLNINMTFDNPEPATTRGTVYTGGLIGYKTVSTTSNLFGITPVTDCFIRGSSTITLNNVKHTVYAGGLVGYSSYTGAETFILNSGISGVSTVSVNAYFPGTTTKYIYAGGLGGYNINVEKSYVSNSGSLVYAGNTAEGSGVYNPICAGGLTGGAGSVIDSYSAGKVKIQTSHGSTSPTVNGVVAAGGLTGCITVSKTVRRSYTTGIVELVDNYTHSGTGTWQVYLGGIAGAGYSTAEISNCAALNKQLLISGTGNSTRNYNRIAPYYVVTNNVANLTNNVSNITGDT